MSNKVNEQYFSKEQIEAGEMKNLLDCLMEEAYGSGETYNDIHIYPEDCGAFTVEWVQVPWSHEYGGCFKYVDENQYIMEEYIMPDGTLNMCFDYSDYKLQLENFLEEESRRGRHYKKNDLGVWYLVSPEEEDKETFKEELK